MQPFGQVPVFKDGDLKLFGKKYDTKHKHKKLLEVLTSKEIYTCPMLIT